MSLRYTISMAFLSILYGTGIKTTIESYAKQAVCSLVNLADVAHMRPKLEWEIRSNHPEWYSDRMRIFAYEHSTSYWKKKDLTWAIMNDPVILTEAYVASAMETACAKWSAASPFTFQRVSPKHIPKPDIRLIATPNRIGRGYIMGVDHIVRERLKDIHGVNLQYTTSTIWTHTNPKEWQNFRFAVLFQMGQILGLRYSKVPGAVMYVNPDVYHPGLKSLNDYELSKDDKDGIQSKYGPPPSSRVATRTHGGWPPSPSSSSSGTTRTHGGWPPTSSSSSRGTTRTHGDWPPIPSNSSKGTTRTYGGKPPSPSSSSNSSTSSSASSTSSSSSSSETSSDGE